MRVAGIVRDSLVNGAGVRDVIFVQGCGHKCRGCQNPHTWDYNGGRYMSEWDIVEYLKDSDNDITISGGEPLDQLFSLIQLVEVLKLRTTKKVWVYTGYTFKPSHHRFDWMTKYPDTIEVVVDGEFKQELKDPNLLFRGSSNQRLIDVQASLETNSIVLWEESR